MHALVSLVKTPISFVYRQLPTEGGRKAAFTHHLHSANQLIIKKQFAEASKEAERALKIDSNNLEARHMRAKCYSKNGDRKLAIIELTAILAIDPKNVKTLFARADQYSKQNEIHSAIADLSAILAIEPKNWDALADRADFNYDQKEYDLAIKDYTSLCEIDSDATVYKNRGLCFQHLRNFEQAVSDFNAAIALNPSDAALYESRGNCYKELGKFPLAIKDFTHLIHLDPKNCDALMDRTFCYDGKELDLTIEDCTKAIHINSKYGLAYYNRAWAYLKRKENVRALKDITIFCLLEPKDREGVMLRGKCLRRLGESEAAFKDLSAAATDKDGLYMLGKWHHREKDYDKAIENYTAALGAKSHDDQTLLQRARCYVEKKEPQKALLDCEAALKINSNNQKVKKLKDSIKI